MKRTIIIALLIAGAAHATPVPIRDTGYTGFGGTLFSGRITITAPDMTTQDDRTINRWEQSYMIVDGAISIDLEPNDTAVPAGTSYIVVYRPRNGQAWSERWVVPSSASPLKVNQVRVLNAPAPTVMIQPQQIQSGGATAGQALLWNGSRYAPGNVATSTAWGGIVGSLANQMDLANALAGKAQSTHLHLIPEVTGLQSALDSSVRKPSGSGVYLAENYCAVAGTYNHTCLANAINAVPASGGIVHLGDRIYTIGATVAVTGRKNLVIAGMGPQVPQLLAANNLNAAMLNFTDTLNCTLKEVGIDGNKANQTSGSAVEFHATGFTGYGLAISNARIANAKDYNIKAQAIFPTLGTVLVSASELADSGNALIYAESAGLVLSGSHLMNGGGTNSQVHLKNAQAQVVGNYFDAGNVMQIAAIALDTDGSVTYVGNQKGGSFIVGDVNPLNGATAASIHGLVNGSTYIGKYQDVGSCHGTVPALSASWATANSLVCLGNGRAAVGMPHGQDTSALFTFDVTGIDLASGTLLVTPVGHIASTSGTVKWKLDWACTSGSAIPMGDASVPYTSWNVQNINSWWGGYNTQVRGLTNIGISQTNLPNPCDLLQVKITHTGTDPGETNTATLSLVGLRIQYYVKTN